MSETHYTLEVYGSLWSGQRAVYSYSLDSCTAVALIKAETVKERAGDFEAVIDWRLVEHASTYEKSPPITRRVDTWKTLRGFRNGMTPKRFYKLANT